MRIVEWLRQKMLAVVARFKKPKPEPTPKPAPGPAPKPAPPEPPKDVLFDDAQLAEDPPGRPTKSAELRRLERRRLKHDKFVTPKGERPPKVEREPAPPKPKPEPVPEGEPEGEPDGHITRMHVFGKHHEDTQDVYYHESEFYGMFNFRDTILQQLERYFVYLARMKKYDSDSYGFYRQYGAQLLPYVNVGAHDRHLNDDKPDEWKPFLAEWFHLNRPSFGCYAYGTDPETEKYELTAKGKTNKATLWVPKFMYFTKLDKPSPNLQMMKGGDIYTMTVWWDRPHDPKYKRKYGTPQEFGIFVSDDGQRIVALRSLRTNMRPIKAKRGAYRGYTVHIPQRGWQYPSEFESWAKDNGEDAQAFLTRLFLSSVQRHANAQRGMVRIAVHKDDMTAVFSVNHEKMGYFFQDRDIHIGETGARKKIFHMVRAHTRKDGAEVPLHFRGEREFTWADYDVKITVPGYDHTNFDELDVGIIDEHWMDEKESYLNQEEVGKIFAEKINRVH